MYNTKLVCAYNSDEIFKGLENIGEMTEKDKEVYQDAYYRYELLNILGLEEYDEKELSEAVSNLYEKIKDCTELKECMLKLAANFMSLDDELGLMMLFAYDYMYLAHICISDFLETGKITDANIVRLKSLIF